MSEQKPKYQAPALAKGLEILELLASSADGLSLVEIAKSLGRSKSELYRMLVELEQRGYAEKLTGTEAYRLTNKMFTIAMSRPPMRNLVATSLPHMQRLVEGLDQSCHLAVLNGDSIVVVNRMEAPGELGFAVRLGYMRRIDRSTSGAVIAAYASDRTRERILALLKARVPDFDSRAFAEMLDLIRRTGHFEHASAIVRGVIDIGVPIFDQTGASCAALTVPFIERDRASTDKPTAIKMLVAAGSAISEELSAGGI